MEHGCWRGVLAAVLPALPFPSVKRCNSDIYRIHLMDKMVSGRYT